MSCQHPYDEVSEEHIRFTFENAPLEQPDGKPVRVAVKFCTECSHIIDVDSFENGFPLEHLSDKITTDEDCQHPFDYVVEDGLTFEVEDKPIEPKKLPTVDVMRCEKCHSIVQHESENIPLTTL